MLDRRVEADHPTSPSILRSGGNELLAILTDTDLDLIAPSCIRRRFERKAVLIDAGQDASAIYFIEAGVASVIKPHPSSTRAEIALLGPETFAGAAVVIGDSRSPYRTFVQTEHLTAVCLPAEEARRALSTSPSLQQVMTRAVYAQMVQIAEGLVSAAWQRMNARLARWLLMYRDRMRSDRLEVTHEFMAMMLGAQRTGITETLHELEGAGLVSATRGVVVICDPSGLETLADGGYGVAEREHARLKRPASANLAVEQYSVSPVR